MVHHMQRVHQFPVAATTSSTTVLSQSSTVTYTSAQTATTLPMATVTSVERSSTVPSATTPIPTLDTDDIQLGEDFMNCNRVMDDISLNCVVATSDPTVSLFDSQCPTPCLDEQPQPALFPDLLSVELFSPLKLAPSPLENSEPQGSASALPSAEGTESGPSPIPTPETDIGHHALLAEIDALNREVIGTPQLAQAQSESETDGGAVYPPCGGTVTKGDHQWSLPFPFPRE